MDEMTYDFVVRLEDLHAMQRAVMSTYQLPSGSFGGWPAPSGGTGCACSGGCTEAPTGATPEEKIRKWEDWVTEHVLSASPGLKMVCYKALYSEGMRIVHCHESDIRKEAKK